MPVPQLVDQLVDGARHLELGVGVGVPAEQREGPAVEHHLGIDESAVPRRAEAVGPAQRHRAGARQAELLPGLRHDLERGVVVERDEFLLREVVRHRPEQPLRVLRDGVADELHPAVQRAPLRRVVARHRPVLPRADHGEPACVDPALGECRLHGLGTLERQGPVARLAAGGVRVADDPQPPLREVRERPGDVVEERRRGGLDRRLVAVEADAVEVVPLPGREGVLHHLAAVLLGPLVRGLRPREWRQTATVKQQPRRRCQALSAISGVTWGPPWTTRPPALHRAPAADCRLRPARRRSPRDPPVSRSAARRCWPGEGEARGPPGAQHRFAAVVRQGRTMSIISAKPAARPACGVRLAGFGRGARRRPPPPRRPGRRCWAATSAAYRSICRPRPPMSRRRSGPRVLRTGPSYADDPRPAALPTTALPRVPPGRGAAEVEALEAARANERPVVVVATGPPA